uniref:Hypothetical chloroplast RF20 n=1 Tax=Neglectella solitaria TaxID=120749 RepID=C7BEI7_NEGSO|nr:hypothetical chloroplast RF20 [Neglectella solitaria]
MVSQTRFFRFLKENFLLNEKFFFKKINFSSAIFFIFSGFLFGNLFCTFLICVRSIFIWDGFIILNFILFIEIINYIIYHKKGRFFLLFWNFPFSFQKKLFLKNFNYFKIGFLLGFFIDAFKVGS